MCIINLGAVDSRGRVLQLNLNIAVTIVTFGFMDTICSYTENSIATKRRKDAAGSIGVKTADESGMWSSTICSEAVSVF